MADGSIPAYQVQDIDVQLLLESKTNPRKRFVIDDEFVETIKKKGVIEPILVRPLPLQPRANQEFEIVFGARRFRGTKKAGLKTIPCMVRDLDDAEAYELQVIENGKRQDLDALEEGESYQVLHERFGHDVETIAAKVGKSRSHVYQRITLNKLHPDAKKLYLEGKLTASTALLISRVPVSLQLEAAKAITEGEEPKSFRDASFYVQRKYMLKLIDAPFSRSDETLVPAAGKCNACPKKTGAQNELFEDSMPKDMCTDPICYGKKVDAQWEAIAAKSKLDGHSRVLSKSENKLVFPSEYTIHSPREGYVRLDAHVYDDSKSRTYEQLLKGSDVITTFGRVGGTIIEMVKESDAKAAFKKLGHSFAKNEPSSGAGSSSNYKPPPKKDKSEEDLKKRTRELLTKAVVAHAVKKAPNADFWRAAIVELKRGEVPLDDLLIAREKVPAGTKSNYLKDDPKVTKALDAMSEGELRGVAVEMLVGPEYYESEVLGAFCKLYGVDAKATIKRAKEELADEQLEKETGAKLKGMPAKDAKEMRSAQKLVKTSSKDIKAKKAAKKGKGK